MIVVTVELISAIDGRREVLGTMIIANDGKQEDPRLGDYDVKVGNKRDVGNLRAVYHQPQRTGRLERYPRLAYNIWRLVSRALRSAFPEEK